MPLSTTVWHSYSEVAVILSGTQCREESLLPSNRSLEHKGHRPFRVDGAPAFNLNESYNRDAPSTTPLT